jgi:serine/threonine protein kinase
MEQSVVIGKKYNIIKKLGEGSFGQLYIGENILTKESVAIKLEDKRENAKEMLKHEAKIYRALNGIKEIPAMRNFGNEGHFNYLIMDLLGESLDDIKQKSGCFTITYALGIAIEMIEILEKIHERGIVHRDIKPPNFLIKTIGEKEVINIIDFGLSRSYIDENYKHIPMQNTKSMVGTARYASLNVHQGTTYSRRDDLESLGYTLIYLLKDKLPWQGIKEKNKITKYNKIYECKKTHNAHVLCMDIPPEFEAYLDYTQTLDFSEKPNYQYLKNLFKNLQSLYNPIKTSF